MTSTDTFEQHRVSIAIGDWFTDVYPERLHNFAPSILNVSWPELVNLISLPIDAIHSLETGDVLVTRIVPASQRTSSDSIAVLWARTLWPITQPNRFQSTSANEVSIQVTPRVPVAFSKTSNEPAVLTKSIDKIRHLADQEAGWYRYSDDVPTEAVVEHATNWLTSLYDQVLYIHEDWIEPNITPSEDGEIVFEWWNDDKKLTVYVEEQTTYYLKLWGSASNDEIVDGSADSEESQRDLWKWFMGPSNE